MGEALRDGGLKNLLRLLKRKIAGTPGTNSKNLGTVRAGGPLGAGDKPGTNRGQMGNLLHSEKNHSYIDSLFQLFACRLTLCRP